MGIKLVEIAYYNNGERLPDSDDPLKQSVPLGWLLDMRIINKQPVHLWCEFTANRSSINFLLDPYEEKKITEDDMGRGATYAMMPEVSEKQGGFGVLCLIVFQPILVTEITEAIYSTLARQVMKIIAQGRANVDNIPLSQTIEGTQFVTMPLSPMTILTFNSLDDAEIQAYA